MGRHLPDYAPTDGGPVSPSRRSLWRTLSVAGRPLRLLNLDHPEVAHPILEEMGRGFSVYYDRRWGVTERLCRLLLEEPEWTAGKAVLVLGAGVGAEAVAAGLGAREIHLNDLSPVALELSVRQLRENGVAPHRIHLHPGDFSRIPLPDVDLALGCYVVWDTGTRRAVARFLERFPGPVLLMNGEMPHFRRLLAEIDRAVEPLLGPDDPPCVRVGVLRGCAPPGDPSQPPGSPPP